jgi:hypothetical protein
MVRRYSAELVELVENTPVYRLGIDLANTCIKANLPAMYVAEVFEVSRYTVHTWFRGGAIRPRKRPRIETFIQLVEEDMQKGLLPAKTLRDARLYLGDMVGREIASKESD